MKTAIMILGGAIFAFTAAAYNDGLAEERYRMKQGRYSPAEEARRERANSVPADPAHGQSCCRRMHSASGVAQGSTRPESWFRAKLGRSTPAAELRRNAAENDRAAHIRRCEQLGRCPLVMARKVPSAATTAAEMSFAEARLQAKYGRNTQEHAAQEAPTPCNQECCKHAE